MNFSKGGVIHRDTHKGGGGGKIQAMGTYRYFIVLQVLLLGVSYHCIKKYKRMTCTHDLVLSPMEWILYPALDL